MGKEMQQASWLAPQVAAPRTAEIGSGCATAASAGNILHPGPKPSSTLLLWQSSHLLQPALKQNC